MPDLVACSICGKKVPESAVCSTQACRACHVSISFKDCINHTTPEELAWKARKSQAVPRG
jgi:hypothetical protein